ncbi:MAG: Dam family site-specific DNA-(adenine-N6)-methyltransferase [Deltaproteobacteria bacterium]|nr:Dam family site-specific DNA-(adenine-N6)-methyltransferase [Deltaproteobacteria bacterium]
MKILIPPIKSQGIKTKLVPWIKSFVPEKLTGKWIEPFMGSGVVGFNTLPYPKLMNDINPHLINFYNAVKSGEITPDITRNFLEKEGNLLSDIGESHYYSVRERFNKYGHPLDFLFLNRAGFNGMIRFNRKGNYNVPFCRKPERFSRSYITRISNQVAGIQKTIFSSPHEFLCFPFEKIITEAVSDDFIYCDPPYVDRYADYFNGWTHEKERKLFKLLNNFNGRFIVSSWHHNKYRKNEFIDILWSNFTIHTMNHFYHVGGSAENRNLMTEALITNY